MIEGDSYGLPRFYGATDKVALLYEETYPEQLRQKFYNEDSRDVLLVSRCFHANTTYSLVSGEAAQIVLLKPQITIIALGLTDLWPAAHRNVAPLQKELLGKDPWVTENEYFYNLQRFAECAWDYGSRVILVSIPPVAWWVNKKYPEVDALIQRYNAQSKILAERNAYIDYLDWYVRVQKLGWQRMIGEDGVHPTAFASAELAADLYATIKIADRRQKNDLLLL